MKRTKRKYTVNVDVECNGKLIPHIGFFVADYGKEEAAWHEWINCFLSDMTAKEEIKNITVFEILGNPELSDTYAIIHYDKTPEKISTQ